MKKYKFPVQGFPPKKDGARSMWGKRSPEAERLINLRLSALKAIGNDILRDNIRLGIRIHIGSVNHSAIGDLDNFITGICDGLMKAHPKCKVPELWDNPAYADVHPDKKAFIVDDSQIVSIQAEKITGDSNQPWYEIVIEAES